MVTRARRGLTTLGEQSILFVEAARGVVSRPFYLAEFLEQCRFIMVACFVPLLLTGLGWGTIVALEAGNFFKLASAEWRIGGFMVLANVREFAPVATGANSRTFASTMKPPIRHSAEASLKKLPASSATIVPQPSPVNARGTAHDTRMKRHCSRNSAP